MPAQVQKSGLLAKLGSRLTQAHEQQKDVPAFKDTGGDLPVITGGVAQLVTCQIDTIKPGKENAGKLFFQAQAVVIQPKEVDGIRTEGRRTRIFINLFDETRGDGKGGKKVVTFEQNYGTMLAHLKTLGFDIADVSVPAGLNEQKKADFIEQALYAGMASLVNDVKPYFEFRTWKGKKATTGIYKDKEPRINHVWCDVIPGYTLNGQEEVVDSSAQVLQANTSGDSFNEFQNEQTTPSEEPDFDSLVAAAMEENAEAVNTLTELAGAVGIDEITVKGMDSWNDVVEAIKSASAEQGGTSEPEPEPEPDPVKGKTYGYKPLDANGKPLRNPKTKKELAPVQCEVTLVDKRVKTVVLKNSADQKTVYKGVKWSDLLPAD